MQTIEFNSFVLPAWSLAALIALESLVLLVKRFAFTHFRQAIDKTTFYYDSLLLSALEVFRVLTSMMTTFNGVAG